MKMDFLTWWSIISTVIGVILLCVSIWLFLGSRNQETKKKAQVKIWMQDASGLSNALYRIIGDNLQDRFSSTNDVCNAVWAVQASAFALYQSLYEERCITEKEYKERQKKLSELGEAQQLANTPSILIPNPPPKEQKINN